MSGTDFGFVRASPMQTTEFEIALSTFERLRTAFPVLSMKLDLRPTHVDVAMDIPAHRVSLSRCTSTFRTEMNFICRRRLSGASGFPAQNQKESRNTSKQFQGCYLESFASLNTGAVDVRSRHSYNGPAGAIGKTSPHGVMCQHSSLG